MVSCWCPPSPSLEVTVFPGFMSEEEPSAAFTSVDWLGNLVVVHPLQQIIQLKYSIVIKICVENIKIRQR